VASPLVQALRPSPPTASPPVAHRHTTVPLPAPCEDPNRWALQKANLAALWCGECQRAVVRYRDGAIRASGTWECYEWSCRRCGPARVTKLLQEAQALWQPNRVLCATHLAQSLAGSPPTTSGRRVKALLQAFPGPSLHVRRHHLNGSLESYIWTERVVPELAMEAVSCNFLAPDLAILRLREALCLPGVVQVSALGAWQAAKPSYAGKQQDYWRGLIDPLRAADIVALDADYARRFGVWPGQGNPLPDPEARLQALLAAEICFLPNRLPFRP
jgi:hypothetical protein